MISRSARLSLICCASAVKAVLLASVAWPLAGAGQTAAGAGAALPEAEPGGFPRRGEPPRGAPNILLIMTDDVGFGASSTFGGAIPTPTYDELAAEGIRYNEFHVTAMCSPTRAALLTGRNHHAVNMGIIVDLATDRPGYSSVIPKSAATIGEVLQENGYDTAWLGKNHVTPDFEVTPLGPYDHWPNALGFDYFYGYMGGATNQFAPALVENRTDVGSRLGEPGYILDKDLADHAIGWLRMQHTLHPGKPFLMYYAPGTSHSPHMAPQEWIARFKGRFDGGWDRLREEIFARQKRLGVIPANAELTPRPSEIPAWDSLSAEEKAFAAHLMEVYAGMLAYCDDQIGRLFTELKQSGEWDNTLVLYIQGDNGASGEGTLLGTLDDVTGLNGISLDPGFMRAHQEMAGTVRSFANYPVGFAWAMDTPFQWMKRYASHFGGTRDPLVISWPGHLQDRGVVRSQFHHVIDIAPTLYEAAGITPPRTVDGVPQQPLEGVSMLYSFADARAPSPHHSQYFEMMGNRSFYEDGWIAATRPRRFGWLPPQPGQPVPKVDDYGWELYDLTKDYSERWDVAARYPGKLAQLQNDFLAEAAKDHVLPLDDTILPRAPMSVRPYVLNGRTEFVFHRDGFVYPNAAFPDVNNRSWSISATIDVKADGEGAILTQGDWLSGWGLMLLRGRPTFIYKTTPEPKDLLLLSAKAALSPGRHEIRASMRYDGGGLGKGATAELTVDGAVAAAGRLDRTVSMTFPWTGSMVGQTLGEPLVPDYQWPFSFKGEIEAVEINLERPD